MKNILSTEHINMVYREMAKDEDFNQGVKTKFYIGLEILEKILNKEFTEYGVIYKYNADINGSFMVLKNDDEIVIHVGAIEKEYNGVGVNIRGASILVFKNNVIYSSYDVYDNNLILWKMNELNLKSYKHIKDLIQKTIYDICNDEVNSVYNSTDYLCKIYLEYKDYKYTVEDQIYATRNYTIKELDKKAEEQVKRVSIDIVKEIDLYKDDKLINYINEYAKTGDIENIKKDIYNKIDNITDKTELITDDLKVYLNNTYQNLTILQNSQKYIELFELVNEYNDKVHHIAYEMERKFSGKRIVRANGTEVKAHTFLGHEFMYIDNKDVYLYSLYLRNKSDWGNTFLINSKNAYSEYSLTHKNKEFYKIENKTLMELKSILNKLYEYGLTADYEYQD